MSEAFKAPEVKLGQMVYWFPAKDHHEPFPAIVTGVGQDTLCVNFFQANIHNLGLKDGVRHVDDPRAKLAELRSNGVWSHTPEHLEYVALKAQVQELKRAFQELTGPITASTKK
jgi:hypothetical protein